jgi:hypothetical protein
LALNGELHFINFVRCFMTFALSKFCRQIAPPWLAGLLLSCAVGVFAQALPSMDATPTAPTTTTVRLGTTAIPDSDVEADTEANEAAPLLPPLSIDDASALLRRAMNLLEPARQGNEVLTTPTLQAIQQCIALVQSYVERTDRMHPTLPLYTWQRLLSSKAPRNGWGTLELKLDPPLSRITALALSVHNGDVEINKVVAVASDKTRWEFNQSLLLIADSPRNEVYFLPLATELVSLHVTCRLSGVQPDSWPRLFVDAGICALPESAKQANYHLQLARAEAVRGAPEPALRQIRLAANLLNEYRRTRNL